MLIRFIAVLALVLASDAAARAQTTNRTFQDSMGRTTGRSSTDTRGNTTFYNERGQNTGRSVTTSSGTVFYDSMGRQTGRSNNR